MLFLAHALMLLGADEISSLEMGGVRYIRPLDAILVLYGADVKPFAMALPEWLQGAVLFLIGLPGWAVFAGIGGLWPAFSELENSLKALQDSVKLSLA